jgi:hypothetical protein
LYPGDILQLTLYWQGITEMDTRYTVFTHLVGQAFNPATQGPVWAQHDGEPLDGGWPTTQWLPGERIADVHMLTIPVEAPPGEYMLKVGLYELATGGRLSVWDANDQPLGDHVLLESWPLREAP